MFKVAMLLLAVMSSTKGLYGGVRSQGGISATVECLESCLAGTMTPAMIKDKLDILEDDKILNRDEHGNATRLQLPFKSGSGDEFNARFNANDKKYTRYQMFTKDGVFSSAFEKRALDENDATSKRIKVAVCCAEILSIKNRLAEIDKELDKSPFKLGLLLVTVKDDTQALAIQTELEKLAQDGNERLIIALVKAPFTDEKRREWLTRMTKAELASEAGQTASSANFKVEMVQIVQTWINQAVSGSKITAWHGSQTFNNQYGMPQLRKTIVTEVLKVLFPYAPETIVVTSTAYKACNDPAPLVGIQKKTNNSQLKSVLSAMQGAGILEYSSIDELAHADGSNGAKSIAAVADLVRKQMKSGQRVVLGDLWEKLRDKPFGYYDTIACGVILGFIFSYYKDSAFSWTDNAQSTHVLGESTLKTMVYNMCKGKMTTDYLSAGTVTFQNFREYAKAIFNLTDVQVANETECWRNIRESITMSGSPLWSLKYLDEGAYINPNLKEVSLKVVDELVSFVMQESERESIMNTVLNLMTGRGKVRHVLQKSFQDKATLAAAFRKFLFSSSTDLKSIATKLNLQPEPLNDKLHQVMQAAIYTWTEEQVTEKLEGIVQEYRYLDALNNVIGKECHSIEEARKEILNVFRFFRISMEAIEKLNLSWYSALRILFTVSKEGVSNKSSEEQIDDIKILQESGRYAMSALKDAKPVLNLILESKSIECTPDELDTVYAGLRDMSYDSSIGQFESALKRQTDRIQQARNRIMLLNKWVSLTGKETVKAWCVDHKAPIQWIVPKEYCKAIETVIDTQNNIRVMDSQIKSAIQMLSDIDVDLMNDDSRIENALIETIGLEYKAIWKEEGDILLSKARHRNGSDMSIWSVRELISVQKLLKEAQQDKAKKEKLSATKISVQNMEVPKLRDKVKAFLDQHPEFCDSFME